MIQLGSSRSGETWSVGIKLDDELGAHRADDGGEERAAEQAEQDDRLAPRRAAAC